MINNNEKGAALLRIAEVIGEDDLERINEYSSIAKISCNLLYKTIEKQIEIDEIDYE